MSDIQKMSKRKAAYARSLQKELAIRTPEQVATDEETARRNARHQMPRILSMLTPQEVIETRTLHIEDRKRSLNCSYADQFRRQIEAEIASCESEIAGAKYRLGLGLTGPYHI